MTHPPGLEDAVAREMLDTARIPLRLSVVTGSGFPSIVSLWSVRRQGKIYCATKASAYIASKVRANEKVAFEVSCETPPYRGVRGLGRARIVPELGQEILEQVLTKFLGGVTSPLAKKLLADPASEVAIEITPFRMMSWDFSRRMKDSLPAAVR